MMEQPGISAIQAIQAILAPALGMSAVGLLLLSLGNRYSSIVNRIRLLNDEKRKYSKLIADKGDLAFPDNARFMSINRQCGELLLRSRMVRNAILSFQLAIALFVLTSAAIGLNLFAKSEAVQIVPLVIFIVGMFCVFVGILFAAAEIYRSYKIVLIEVRGED